MASFFGITEYTLDEKNRLFLPPKFREELKKEKAHHLIITTGLEQCLFLFLPSQWEDLVKNIDKLFNSKNQLKKRAFKRFFFGNASEAPLDGIGRILINNSHKNYAKLERKIVIVGVGNKAEIWSEKLWKNYQNKKINPNKASFGKIYDI